MSRTDFDFQRKECVTKMGLSEVTAINKHPDWRKYGHPHVLERWQCLIGTGGVMREWSPGSVLLLGENPPKKAYLVEKGIIALTHELDSGRQVFITLRRPGQMFGHDDLFFNNSLYLSACALTSAVVRVIDTKWLLDQVKKGGEACLLLSQQYERDLSDAAAQLGDMMQMDASMRFQRLLAQIAEIVPQDVAKDTPIDLPLTDGHIASLLGISAQQFSAVKRKLKRTNKVRFMKQRRTWVVYSSGPSKGGR